MAEAGPYGITQFDAPGVIGNMQNMQFNRVRMMMAQKQLEMTERQMNIQQGTMQALQAYAQSLNGGSSGAYGTSAGSNASGASSGAGSSASAPAASSAPVTSMPHASDVVEPPAQPAGQYDANGIPTAATMEGRQRVLTGLAVLNPEMAESLSKTFGSMDTSQVAAVTQRHTRIAQLAAGALQLPQNERAAFVQQHSAELQSLGMPAQAIQSFQPTDANLRQLVAEGMDIERVAQMSKPELTQTQQGATQRIVNPNMTSQTIFESPTVVGPNNQVYMRPPGMSTMPQGMTATNPKTGERVQSLDGGKTWQPLQGGQPGATAAPAGGFQ